MFDKATIIPVSTRDVDLYWPSVSQYIESATEHTDGEISLQDIHSDIANQDRQLWVIKYQGEYIAAVVTKIYTYDEDLKIGEITFAGGKDHVLWDHFADVVGEWFRNQDCKFIDIVGRPGWKKLYEKRGFRPKYLVLRKSL